MYTPVVKKIQPISFPCHVDGQSMVATITSIEENPIHYIYLISFSNGHETSMGSSEEAVGGWFEENGSGSNPSPYVLGVKNDLNVICGFNPNRPPHCLVIEHNGEEVNVWVKDDITEEGKYSVYFKGDYRFSISGQANSYEYHSVRKDHFIDKVFAEKILARLGEVE